VNDKFFSEDGEIAKIFAGQGIATE